MKNPPRNRRGFSLMELLIASVVVAMAGALLSGGLLTANRSTDQRIEQFLTAQLLASELALLDDALSDDTPHSGTFPAPLNDFHWTLDLEEAPVPLAPLVRSTLTVMRKGHASHVVTYRPIIEEQ